eukprot:snap_masked-scaffold_14-processed-gene-2.34-mRNA-1 protein AED:1.00 eAED:1.00 QI:0/-1/0/0/-1/1/1/0/605
MLDEHTVQKALLTELEIDESKSLYEGSIEDSTRNLKSTEEKSRGEDLVEFSVDFTTPLELAVFDLVDMYNSDVPYLHDLKTFLHSIQFSLNVMRKCSDSFKFQAMIFRIAESKHFFYATMKDALFLILGDVTFFNPRNNFDAARVEIRRFQTCLYDSLAKNFYQVFCLALELEEKTYRGSSMNKRFTRSIRKKPKEGVKDLFLTCYADICAQIILLWLQESFDSTACPMLVQANFRFKVLQYISNQFLGFCSLKKSNSLGSNNYLPDHWTWARPKEPDDVEKENAKRSSPQALVHEAKEDTKRYITYRETLLQKKNQRLEYLENAFDCIKTGNFKKLRRNALYRKHSKASTRRKSPRPENSKYATFKKITTKARFSFGQTMQQENIAPVNDTLIVVRNESQALVKKSLLPEIEKKTRGLPSNLVLERAKFRRVRIMLSHSPLISYLFRVNTELGLIRYGINSDPERLEQRLTRTNMLMMQSYPVVEMTQQKDNLSREEREEVEALRYLFFSEAENEGVEEDEDEDRVGRRELEKSYETLLEEVIESQDQLLQGLEQDCKVYANDKSQLEKEFKEARLWLRNRCRQELEIYTRRLKEPKIPSVEKF